MRKTATIVIDAPGRDHGKVFLLQEMPAMKAEKWAIRAFLALARNGVEIPDDLASAGLAGIAAMGIKAFGGMTYADVEPLVDEMFTCVSIIPDATRPQVVRALITDDIDEIATLLHLRKEVFALHVDFSKLAAPWMSASAASTAPEGSPTA